MYIKILKKISTYINIYFLYITPCKNKNIFSIKKNETKYQLNNLLIDMWGQYETMYEKYIFQSKKIKIINIFKKNQKKNLLNQIKDDLLKNNIYKINKKNKRFLELKDNSISINICYNKKNEIEILHKKILIYLHKNSNIKPQDIVITSFSTEIYIPYIHLIFKSEDKKKQIPFFISENFSKTTKIILSSFKKLLDLSNSRFQNKEILQLLEDINISKKFNISEEEIKILYHWIKEANIRWGIDYKHKEHLLFPPNNQNTWFYGIEKLLFSYTVNGTNKIWNNILSCCFINGSRIELVEKFIIFINTLKKWKKKLSNSYTLIYWRSISKELINDFFFNNLENEKSIRIIQNNWIKMIDDSLISCYSKKISINLLKKFFFHKYMYTSNNKFMPGVVNFCHPSTICYIPFKIIFFIGADYQSTVPKNNLNYFNLLNKKTFIGDPDVYQKNCYLFLQMLTCCEKYFYISYVGYSIHDHNQIYSSALIDQLLDYIALQFSFKNNENLSINDNKKKIINQLCKKYKEKYFYEQKNIDTILEKSYQNKLQKNDINLYSININHKKTCNLKNFYKISLINLINFWKHPIRYFFNINLKIKFNLIQQDICTVEPFTINKLDEFKIKKKILTKIIKNKDTKDLFKYYMLSGKLPYNSLGRIFWEENFNKVISIAELSIKNRILTHDKTINLKIEKYQINGILSEIQSTGLLRWQPNIINYSDRISLWLEHLIYSITGGSGESKIIGYKNQIWSFRSLNADTAYNYLLKYIKGYIQGIQKPLLLTKSGASWLDQVYSIKNHSIQNDSIIKKKGNKRLLNTWIGNNHIKGEKEDIYIYKTIKELNKKKVEKICHIAKKWLIPILENKKINKK